MMGYTPFPLQKLGIDKTTTAAPGSGNVVGPSSSLDGHLAVFDGTTGKLIKDGGVPGTGGGSVVIESDTLTGTTADPTAYNSGDFLYNTVYRKLWLNISQIEWHLMSGGSGTPGVYSATYGATY